MLAIFQDLGPVDENMFYTNGILLRLLEGGDIRDRFRVEDHYIGEHTLLQKAAIEEASEPKETQGWRICFLTLSSSIMK